MAAAATRHPLAVLACLLAIGVAAAEAESAQTLKERLSDKASDEQRVNDCGVPVERRGPDPRPVCPGEADFGREGGAPAGGQAPGTPARAGGR